MIFYRSKQDSKVNIRIKHDLSHLKPMFNTIRKHNPDLFIELGTFYGGLTLAIYEEFKESLEIVSFEIEWWNEMNAVIPLLGDNVKLITGHNGDVLSRENEILVDILKDKTKRKILYCDNGDKAKEINMYAQYLNVGDVIGRHDFKDKRHKPSISTIKKNNFVPFNLTEWKSKGQGFVSRFWVKEK